MGEGPHPPLAELVSGGKGNNAGSAADKFVDFVFDAQGNRRRPAITPPHPERVAREPQVERMPSIADAHVETLHFLRQFRIEPQKITSNLDACRYTLQQIDRPGHRAEMHALRCGVYPGPPPFVEAAIHSADLPSMLISRAMDSFGRCACQLMNVKTVQW